MDMTKFVLASGSPRRKELLEQIGMKFEVSAAQSDEVITAEKPHEIVEELSRQKALEVSKRYDDEKRLNDKHDTCVIIGADTMVSIDMRASDIRVADMKASDTEAMGNDKNDKIVILGKPRDRDDAIRMLTMLQGRTHQVYTGVTVVVIKDDKNAPNGYEKTVLTFHERTDVSMYNMTPAQIERYADSKEPLDKAGAYAIQGLCAAYIKGINGDYNNVVGLPVARLVHELSGLGIDF